MIGKGIPKPSVLGALAQNTVWYFLLTVLAVAVIFGVSDEQFWQLPSAYAVSDPAYDSANSGTAAPRSFVRGISESLAVTSTFGGPSAPNHYTRAMSESISVTSTFPGQAQSTGQAAGSMRTAQYSPGINQRGDERINMTFKSLKRNDLVDKTLTGGTQYLNLEVLAASPSTPDSFSGEMEGSGDASDPDDNSNFLHLVASNAHVDQEKGIQNAALLNASISAVLLGGAFGVVAAKHPAFSGGRTQRSVLALFLFKRETVPQKAGAPAKYVFLVVLVLFTFSSFAISITPSSGQEYAESLFKSRIELTSAYHLDSDRTVESDIYEESRKLDGIWTEEISDGHYVRLTFEQDLTSVNDITVYPRVVSGNPVIKVYEKDGTEIIAEFASLRDNQYNKVLLTHLQGSSDIFDLRVRDGSVEFDHIVDPALPSLRPTADGTCVTVEGSGGTTNCPANLFAEVDDDPDTPTNTDWIANNNYQGSGSSASGSIFFLLTDMPSDFSSMDTLQIDAYILKNNFVNDQVTWVAQVFQSDETTSLTNQVTLATEATSDGLVSVSFSSVTAGNKAIWDGARLKLSSTAVQNGSPDDFELRITAVELDGSYTASGGTFSRTPSDSVTITDSPARTFLASRSAADTVTVADSIAHTLAASRSAAESITITDSISMSVTRDITDTVTLTDTAARLLVASRSISDSVTLTDSISIRVSRSLSDTFTVTDSVTANKSFSRSTSDSLIVTDSAGRSYVTSRTATDAMTVTDSISTTVSRSISDSTTISDSIVGTKVFTRSISETLTTTDSTARTLVASRSAADTVAVTDSVATSGVFARSAPDAITVTDSIAAGKHFDRSISDSTIVTDSISMTVSRDLADSTTITDNISAALAASRSISDSTTLTDSISTTVSRSLADSITVTDSIAAGKHFDRALADSTTVTDNAARTYLSSRAAADTVTISDSTSPRLNRLISDSVTISDSITAGKSFSRSLSDTVTVTDGIVMSATRDIADSVTLSDSISKSLVASRSTSDSLSVADTLAHGVSRSTSDTLSVTEVITAQKAFGRPTSDSISITDTPATALATSRSTSDSAAISDAITTTFHVARSISDAVTVEDAVTAGKHFDRSVADSATVTDSIAKAISRSITDSVTLSDNIALSITISRPLSDSLFITDAIAHGVSRSTSDTLSVTDEIVAEKAFGKPVSDSISVTDNAATTLEASRSTSDSVAVSDAITTAYHAARSISDTVTTEVQVTAGKSFTREIADTIATTDSPATTLSATRTISDTATLSDSAVRQVVLSMSVSETVSVTANVVAGILYERTLSDSFTVTEAISITTGVARSAAESLTIADNITFELGPNRSMAETIVITDSIARSVIASRSPSDTLMVEDIIGDHFDRDVSDTLAIGVTVDVVVHVPVVEIDDTVNVNAQLSVSVNRSLTFDESLTLGECTPFACNQVINLYETPAQFLTDELRIGRIDVDLEDSVTVSDSITAGNLFEKQVSDTLATSDRSATSMKAAPPAVPSEWSLTEMPRLDVASDSSLVRPSMAPSLSGTFDTSSGVAGIVSQTGMPTYDTSSIFTATDMTGKTLVLPMFRVAVEYTDPLPANNGMITPVISSIPANTAISVPVDIDATTTAALGVGHPIRWVDLEFTPGVDATDVVMMINMLENEPAGADLVPDDKARFYLDIRFDGDFPLDVGGNPIDPSTEGYYTSPPTFTFAITDEWADENNAERDADGVPIFSISLLDETTGEWEDLGGITFVSEEDGVYTYTVSLDHFSTYAVTANEVIAPTGGGGRRDHAIFTVPLAESLQTIDATKGVAIEVIEEFGGQKFRVSLTDLLAISVRPVAYQTFPVSENVQVSIGMAGITEEGILPQTAKATFLIQVDNFGPTYETFRLDFWYYDQSGDRAYESSQEIAIGPFETRELTIQVPFSSAGTFAVVAEARSVPEGNLINTAQFTVNIPWLSIYLYSLLSVAAAIIGVSAAVVAILLIKRNVQTPSVLAVPLRRLAGAASALSIIRKSGASSAIAAKIDSVARSLKNIRDIQAAEPEKDAGTDGLSVSANWANAFHGSLLAGEYTAIIDFDAVNQSKNQIFLMRYWAVDMAGEVVYSYSETMTLDSDKPKSWRMHVELPASGEYVFHMEAKFARDGKVASSAQLVIKVP